MPQLYLLLTALLAIGVIVYRREYIFNRERVKKFKEEVASKVDQLQKERQLLQKERFKDLHMKRQQEKKHYDFSRYKLMLRKADVAIAKAQWNEAKKCLIQSMAIHQTESSVSLKLAKVYFESGDLKKAEMLYRRLLEAGENHSAVFCHLAKIYTKKKKYKEAVQYYVQAIEHDESDDKSLIGLGYLYQLLMRHSLAAECFRRAAELKPREIHYLFLLAESCAAVEDYENALFTYEKILTLEPYNEKAQNAAREVRVKMKEMESLLTSI